MTQLKEAVAEYLRERAGLREARIICEYPSTRALPLERPVVALGLDGVDLSPSGLGNYLGAGNADDPGEISLLYGSAAIITLRLDIYLPGSDGAGCHRLYEDICAALGSAAARFGLLRLWCEPIRYDSAAGASCLSAKAALRAAFTARETQVAITDYHVRSELNV